MDVSDMVKSKKITDAESKVESAKMELIVYLRIHQPRVFPNVRKYSLG